VSLKLNPGKLITTGLWKYLRNPNYFGELLIYASFLILAADLYATIVLGSFILFVWVPNMQSKEKSLSRFPEFEHYRRQSWQFIPFLY
jgi:steroid 5-alpha reductase family enzyme